MKNVILYGKIANISANHLYICSPPTVVNEFSIFAYIIEHMHDGVRIRRYDKYGKRYCGDLFLTSKEFFEYYELYYKRK